MAAGWLPASCWVDPLPGRGRGGGGGCPCQQERPRLPCRTRPQAGPREQSAPQPIPYAQRVLTNNRVVGTSCEWFGGKGEDRSLDRQCPRTSSELPRPRSVSRVTPTGEAQLQPRFSHAHSRLIIGIRECLPPPPGVWVRGTGRRGGRPWRRWGPSAPVGPGSQRSREGRRGTLHPHYPPPPVPPQW